MRECAEQCSNLEGFIVTHNASGYTGANLIPAICENLAANYANKVKCCVSGFEKNPKYQQAVNSALSLVSSIENVDLSICMDNQSLHKICRRNLELSAPSLQDYNRLVAYFLSSFTSPMRHSGSLNASLIDIASNLQPYPKIHYSIPSVVPILSMSKMNFKTLDTQTLTNSLFLNDNQFLDCDLDSGKYVSCYLGYQGSGFSITDIYNSVSKMCRTMKFVDYCEPERFKLSLNSFPPFSSFLQKNSTNVVCRLCNTTSINLLFKDIEAKFSQPNQINQVEGDIMKARENLLCLIKDYDEVAVDFISEDKNVENEDS